MPLNFFRHLSLLYASVIFLSIPGAGQQVQYDLVNNDSVGISFDVPAGWYAEYTEGDYYFRNRRSAGTYMVLTAHVPADLKGFATKWNNVTKGRDMKFDDSPEYLDSLTSFSHISITTGTGDTVVTSLGLKSSKWGYTVGVYYIKNTSGAHSHMSGLVRDITQSIAFYEPVLSKRTLDLEKFIMDKWISRVEVNNGVKTSKWMLLHNDGSLEVTNSSALHAPAERKNELFDLAAEQLKGRWLMRSLDSKDYLYIMLPAQWPKRMRVQKQGDNIYLNGELFELQ